jgi:iron complex outermembrane receptor protein
LLQGDRVKYDPTAAYFTDPLTSGQYVEDRRTLGQITYEDVFADNTLRVTGRLFGGQESFHDQQSYWDRPLQPDSSHDSSAVYTEPAIGQWRGVELRALSTAWRDHKVMFGTEYQENNRIRMNVRNSSNAANDVHIALTGYRLGFFGQDEWQITQTLASTVGLRVDRNDTTGTHWSPRAALIWRAAESTTLKALYGRANRAPNAYESKFGNGVDQISNPALKNETIDTIELVADHWVNRELSLRASVYQGILRDLIVQGIDPATGLSQYQTSTTSVKAHGLELSASQQWDRGARLRGSVSLQDVRYDDGAALSNSPHMLARLNFLAPLPWAGLRMGYELRYDSWRHTEAGDTTGGFVVSNLRLSTSSWARGVELSLDIKNLFDRNYSHPAANINWQDALQQDGRSVGIAMRYSF